MALGAVGRCIADGEDVAKREILVSSCSRRNPLAVGNRSTHLEREQSAIDNTAESIRGSSLGVGGCLLGHRSVGSRHVEYEVGENLAGLRIEVGVVHHPLSFGAGGKREKRSSADHRDSFNSLHDF